MKLVSKKHTHSYDSIGSANLSVGYISGLGRLRYRRSVNRCTGIGGILIHRNGDSRSNSFQRPRRGGTDLACRWDRSHHRVSDCARVEIQSNRLGFRLNHQTRWRNNRLTGDNGNTWANKTRQNHKLWENEKTRWWCRCCCSHVICIRYGMRNRCRC